MPFKRYVRRKRSYVRKSFGKKRMYRKLKIAKKFTKSDGVSAHKFTLATDVYYAAAVQTTIIGWHGNVNTA